MLKKNVLRKNSEFSAVYNKGKSVATGMWCSFTGLTDFLITEQGF